jgi:hypothetical protein
MVFMWAVCRIFFLPGGFYNPLEIKEHKIEGRPNRKNISRKGFWAIGVKQKVVFLCSLKQ